MTETFLKESDYAVATRTPQEILQVLQRPFPANEIKEREGGRGKVLKYVSGASVIKRLIEATDGNYTTELVWKEFITVEVYRKSKPVNAPAMLACVRVTIPGLGSKEGLGIQVLEGGEDMYKGAFTDALKKALTQLGCALDLYATEEESIEPLPQQTLAMLDLELKTLLNKNGIKTQGELSKEMIKKFGTTALTPVHIEQWREELSGKPQTTAF